MGLADLALVAVTLVWGVSFTVIKGALDDVPTLLLVALRFAVAATLLLALRPRTLFQVRAATLRPALLLGVCLFAGFAFQTAGLVGTTPSRSAFLTATSVLLVPVLGRVLFGERVPTRTAGGVLLAWAGVGLLTHPAVGSGPGAGDLLTGLCALGFALHIVVLGHRAPRGASVRELATLQTACVAVLALVASLVFEGVPRPLTARALAAVAFLGVLCSALAIAVQTWAQRSVPATRAGLIFALEPVFAAAIAFALWGERLRPGELLGGALVVAGVIGAVRPGRLRGPDVPPGPPRAN